MTDYSVFYENRRVTAKLYIANEKNQQRLLLKNMEVANTFMRRLKGLLSRAAFNETDGLLITPCSYVHTFGMKFDIDIVFIDKDNCVVGIRKGINKNKITGVLRAKHTLELPAGKLTDLKIKIGDHLYWH